MSGPGSRLANPASASSVGPFDPPLRREPCSRTVLLGTYCTTNRHVHDSVLRHVQVYNLRALSRQSRTTLYQPAAAALGGTRHATRALCERSASRPAARAAGIRISIASSTSSEGAAWTSISSASGAYHGTRAARSVVAAIDLPLRVEDAAPVALLELGLGVHVNEHLDSAADLAALDCGLGVSGAESEARRGGAWGAGRGRCAAHRSRISSAC